jgi:uncharacterized delta-60 repeat protein
VGLTRLDRDGGLDHSFGRGGKTVTSFGACIQNFGMALDSHNRIVVGYVCPTRTVNLIRFKPDGRVDRSFGDDGRVRTHHVQMRGLGALAVDSHDRIDAAGAGKRGAQVLRYNPSGKLDRSFGNDGIATATYPGLRASDASPSSAAIDSRGRIVLAGDFNGFGFTRLKPGGRVDRSFGRKGRVTIHDPHLNSARSVAIDRRGRIVGVGYQRSGSPRHNHPAAVRLLP